MLTAVLASLTVSLWHSANEPESWTTHKPLELGFERCGVRLGFRPDSQDEVLDLPVMPWERVFVETTRSGGLASGVLITSFEELAPYVLVRSGEDALLFVRLRSSWTTNFMFENSDIGHSGAMLFEITDARNASSVPVYGRTMPTPGRNPQSGHAGILGTVDWQRLGVFGPRIRRSGASYVIERWVLCKSPRHGKEVSDRVVLLRELIDRQGRYKATVLDQLDQRLVDSVVWSVPLLH